MIQAFLLRKELLLLASVISGFAGASTHPSTIELISGFFK